MHAPVTIAGPAGVCPYEAESEAALKQAAGGSAYTDTVYLLPDQEACDWSGMGGGGEVWVNGGIGSFLVEHELGHTLGLDHGWGVDLLAALEARQAVTFVSTATATA